jgi:hypothetical protein
MKRFRPSLLAVCIGILGFVSCEIETCKEKSPEIEITNFEIVGDSGIATVYFKDCDGDIGLRPNETGGNQNYNLYFEFEEYNNGIYDTIGPLPLPYYYRVPFINNGANSPLKEGEMFITLYPYYIAGYSDTFRYRVQFFDRARNGSNFAYTETLIAPQPVTEDP